MLGLSGQPEIETIDLASNRLWLLLPIGALACLPIRSWLQSQPFERWKPIWPWLRTAAVPLLIIAALSQAVAGTHAPFIYFRF